MKQIEVQIMGQSYRLGCPEGGEQRMLEAVERVDSAMCRIRDAGKVKARDRIAVLAALNLAFDVPDRSAAALPAAASEPSADAPAGGSVPIETDPRLAALIGRLDQALGGDGHLL
ncbi:cell division protein ZapA [Ramlibacter sp.]|uniref:cell division protein ZapA n=1 Tax=Ramlibacter sp. TaxID=1917967 RepID=UPI0035B09C36